MPYKDPAKRKENSSKYYEINKEKIKENVSYYREKNKEKVRESKTKYAIENKGIISGRQREWRTDLNQHACESITSGSIINQHKWDAWCNILKRNAKKHPYPDDFTNVDIFNMMNKGCFYCGDIAMAIDRIDSTLDHTPDNCVASCNGCNISKGAADPSTFIRKAYYRARGKYMDDTTDIWFVNVKKPLMCSYKKRAEKKKVLFDLTNEDWETFIKGDCEYCHRSPTTWFGVDRMIPSKGYVIENVVSSCFDCNLDKHIADANATAKRNERIASRVDDGELAANNCDKVILHIGNNKTSKVVSVYGNVYASKAEASRVLGKNSTYVHECIRDGMHSDYIFEITGEYSPKFQTEKCKK